MILVFSSACHKSSLTLEQVEKSADFQKLLDEEHPMALYYLGEEYILKNDYDNAIKYFEKSASQYFIPAYCPLAGVYSAKHDYKKARYWYERGVEVEDAEAQFLLGKMYLKSTGIDYNDESYPMAKKLIEKSAEQDYVHAQTALGYMYYVGEAVIQNYQKAFEWYEKAAEQEDPEAQYNLGIMYYKGEGVEKDYDEALKWLNKSCKNGYEISCRQIKYCEQRRK